MARHMVFLSTPSGWRATKSISLSSKIFENFYPRPPGGGRQSFGMQSLSTSRYFYPRPPGGGRRVTINQQDQDAIFLSTPSGWRATQSLKKNKTNCAYFYPRPPGGGRPWTPYVLQSRRPFLSTPSGWRATWGWFDSDIELIFLSTPSGWRATRVVIKAHDPTSISIHALRVEGDLP